MKRVILTDEEWGRIQVSRAARKHEKSELRFHRKVFAVAYDFNEYCIKEGIIPSYSDFVNEYGYQELDSNLMFHAYNNVRDLIRSFELPRKKL